MQKAEPRFLPEGVDYFIVEGACLEFGAYRAEPVTEPSRVPEALSILIETLALYPDGFFEALSDGNAIVFRLAGSISAVVENAVGRPAAVTCDIDGSPSVVLDVSDPGGYLAAVIVHELCHVIDGRLDRLAANDPSHWNRDDWKKLNPPGFDYLYSYGGEQGASPFFGAAFTAEDGNGEIFFADRYSKTFPTEDRARLMELVFSHSPGASCLKSPFVREKLKYYFTAVRYYLDPAGSWTGPTFWEERSGLEAG